MSCFIIRFQVHEEIAGHFSMSWCSDIEFTWHWLTYVLEADVGCGNGKYFGTNHNGLVSSHTVAIFWNTLNAESLSCQRSDPCTNCSVHCVDNRCLKTVFKTDVGFRILVPIDISLRGINQIKNRPNCLKKIGDHIGDFRNICLLRIFNSKGYFFRIYNFD